MECCGFSNQVIRLLMGYNNLRSVDTRRVRIAKRMGIDVPLRKWLEKFLVQ